MAMIDMELVVGVPLADFANVTLLHQHPIVIFDREPIDTHEPAPEVILAILRAILRVAALFAAQFKHLRSIFRILGVSPPLAFIAVLH
jgi:hypothetical protein